MLKLWIIKKNINLIFLNQEYFCKKNRKIKSKNNTKAEELLKSLPHAVIYITKSMCLVRFISFTSGWLERKPITIPTTLDPPIK
jgi:hypothetical protein